LGSARASRVGDCALAIANSAAVLEILEILDAQKRFDRGDTMRRVELEGVGC
jgi:hypothetical protein